MPFAQNVISWEDVEIGKIYRYEEKYELQCEVKVLDKRILNDEDHDNYLEIDLEIVKNYYGGNVGDNFHCGRTSGNGSYFSSGQQFMTMDSWFSYYTPGFQGE